MIGIDKKLIQKLFDDALVNPRLRMNYDLRTSANDGSQRMLNALLPGTDVPIHRHSKSNENVLLICGKLVEVIYDDAGNEKERICLDPDTGNYGCVISAAAWHTVEVLEPSVIYEAKDGKYGEDGSETLEEFKNRVGAAASFDLSTLSGDFQSLDNLKEAIKNIIEMERKSGSMDVVSPLYVSRMLNVPIEDVEKVMREMK